MVDVPISGLPTPANYVYQDLTYGPVTYDGTTYKLTVGQANNRPPATQHVTLPGDGSLVIDPRAGRVVAITTHGSGAPERVRIYSPRRDSSPNPVWAGMSVTVYVENQANASDTVNIYAGGAYGGHGNVRVINPKPSKAGYGYTDGNGVVLSFTHQSAVLNWGYDGNNSAGWAWDASASYGAGQNTTYVPTDLTLVGLDPDALPTSNPHVKGKLFLTGTALNISLG